ncbi:MAG: DNA polymerase III subunit beta [Bacteroidetes bacterium]|nr:DNA polymerase III subunit beta [Bacteroidota bacterium]
MKFIISSSYLKDHLQILGGVISTNNTLPILDHILFDLKEQSLKLIASDLETTISAELEVDSTDSGLIALPAKLLLDTLKTFAEQPLTFIVSDNGTVEISAANGKYALAGADGNDFPKPVSLNDTADFEIQADILATAISKTLFAAGNDDLRPVMSGVLFQCTPTHITFVATDAHKLVKYQRDDCRASESADFIMPKKPLNVLKSILLGSDDSVAVSYTDSNARFSFGTIEIISRLIDGKYPNYEAVIPKENPNVLTVSRSQFLASVRRVSIFSNKTTHQIRLKMAGAEIHISAEDVDYSNKADERLSCAYQGDDLQIGFNSRFLTEMLSALDCEDVQLAMSLPNRAGLLTPIDGLDAGESITMLVMPVMLNS